MDFFTSLLKAYEKAEEIGLVDQQKGNNNPVLLPIYHDNKVIRNNDIYIEVLLDKEGNFYKARTFEVDENVIFPVTYESSIRTSTKIAPHPIVDSWYYVMHSELIQEKQKKYLENLDYWICQTNNRKVESFLQIIRNFVMKPEAADLVLSSAFGPDYQTEKEHVDKSGKIHEGSITYGEKNKKTALKDIKLSFTVIKFEGYKNISVSNFKDLHSDFINLVQKTNLVDIGICNISGKEERIIKYHRSPKGPFERAKLISQNNTIAYIGDRFPTKEASTDIIKIGYETSEKIHLMVKYLMENKNSSVWLGSSQYLINWFSDDLSNESHLDIVDPIFNDFFEDDEGESIGFDKPNEVNWKICSSFIKGPKLFSDNATYCVAILNKTSKGRIAIKYFCQLQASKLLKNIREWQKNYSWEPKNNSLDYRLKTPTFNDIINTAYGVDRDGSLRLDNDSFRSDQYQQLVTALIDGQTIPSSIVKKIEHNIKQRQKYPDCWEQIQEVSLAILHKQYRREFTPMLDHEETDRSYLFGRLLAIYELIEKVYNSSRNLKIDRKEDRVTNAERYWTAFSNQPATIMKVLDGKVRYCIDYLKTNEAGYWRKLENEMQEIVQLLSPIMMDKSVNQPLDYKFIFGYYAEKKFYYTKQVKESEE